MHIHYTLQKQFSTHFVSKTKNPVRACVCV